MERKNSIEMKDLSPSKIILSDNSAETLVTDLIPDLDNSGAGISNPSFVHDEQSYEPEEYTSRVHNMNETEPQRRCSRDQEVHKKYAQALKRDETKMTSRAGGRSPGGKSLLPSLRGITNARSGDEKYNKGKPAEQSSQSKTSSSPSISITPASGTLAEASGSSPPGGSGSLLRDPSLLFPEDNSYRTSGYKRREVDEPDHDVESLNRETSAIAQELNTISDEIDFVDKSDHQKLRALRSKKNHLEELFKINSEKFEKIRDSSDNVH